MTGPREGMVADDRPDGGDDPTGGRLDVGAGADGRTRAERLAPVWSLAELLDSRFRVPGTTRTFGVDALVGLIPGVGGSAGLILSALVILRAIRAGARPLTVVRMVGIAGLDAVIGSIPLLGSVVDFTFKANERNARILAAQELDPDRTAAESRRIVVLVAVLVLAVGVALSVLAVLAVIALVRSIT